MIVPLVDLGFLPAVGFRPEVDLPSDFADSFLAGLFLAPFGAPLGAAFFDDFEDFFFAISRFRIRLSGPQVNKIPSWPD